jgi:hypothetical protein
MRSLTDGLSVVEIHEAGLCSANILWQHVQMLTLKTALILTRSSSLQGSALGLLVSNDYLHVRCKNGFHSRVYAAASNAAKPDMHGTTLSIQAAPGLLSSQQLFLSTSIVIHAIVREALCASAMQSAWKRLARLYRFLSCLMCAVATLHGGPLV